MHVEDCELPKDFIGQPIWDSLGRPFIEGNPFVKEGLSRTNRDIPSWAAEYINLKVWLDMCKQRSEVKTHGGLWGGLCLYRNIQDDPGIVVDSVIAMLM